MIDVNEIIKDNHYPAYVLASAGTGKTELIARKVEDLILNQNVDIDKIALITFTNKATAETIERIKSKLYSSWKSGNTNIRSQIDKLSMAKISTIHLFCDNLIRQYSYEIGLCPNYKISNMTIEKQILANEIVKENYNEEIFSIIPMYKIEKLLIDIETKASDKGYEILLNKVKEKNLWDKLRNYFHQIYPIYTKRLEEIKLNHGTITTNDLIRYAVKILQNKNIATHIKNSIDYLFLDEAQDINFEQAELTKLLISYDIKVFVVGDEKQSIYGFRGSDKKAFEDLISFIENNSGKNYSLDLNYRSNKFIIEKLNKLFSTDFYFKNKKLNFTNQDLVANNENYENSSINMVFCEKISEIIENLAQNFLISKNLCYNNIAILCRTNKEVLQTYNELKESGISAHLYLSKSIYKSKIVVDIVKLLNYISGGGTLEKEEMFFTDFFVSANANNITEKDFYEIISNSVLAFKNEGVLGAITQVFEDTNLLDYYTKTNNNQSLANIQRLTEIIRDLVNDNLTSMEILDYLNVMIVTGQEEAQPQLANDNSVTISTIHTYKGLDNDVIIVNEIDNNLNNHQFADFNFSESAGLSFNKDTLIPNSNIENDLSFEIAKKEILIDNLEEEIRLLYVALTRAKQKLILHSKQSLEKIKSIVAHNKEYVSYLRWIYNI